MEANDPQNQCQPFENKQVTRIAISVAFRDAHI